MKSNLTALGVGLCGTLLALLLWHSYADHLLIHAVVGALSQPQPAAKAPQ